MHSFCGKCHYYIVHSSKLSAFNSKDPLCIRSQVLLRKILIIFRFVDFGRCGRHQIRQRFQRRKSGIFILLHEISQIRYIAALVEWIQYSWDTHTWASACLIYKIHIFIFSFVKSKHVVLCQCLLSHSIIFFIADKTLECKYYAM